MFGELIESRARGPRRTGSIALSVATHVGIIGLAAAVTAHQRPADRTPEKPVVVAIAPPAPRPRDVAPARARSAATDASSSPAPAFHAPQLHVDVSGAPPINLTPNLGELAGSTPATCIDCRGVAQRILGGSESGSSDGAAASEWEGSALLTRIVTSAVPRYPESLRSAGVGGTVLLQFTVDTTGRVDMRSIKVLSSTHDLFAAAARDALARFRFRPAEVAGDRVPALAQMPFEFVIGNR